MKVSKRIFAFATVLGLGVSTYIVSEKLLKHVARFEFLDAPAAIGGVNQDGTLSHDWGIQEIHAPEIWGRHPGSKDVIVAVIDTGCDISHPELAGNVWTNPGESGLDENGLRKENNEIDDDANGFVDDLHGWSFVSNSNDVFDEHGHGTHIAGIIGARKLDGLSSSGVAPRVSLMILKYFDASHSGFDHLEYSIEAIRYAVKMGADIINYSGGGSMRSGLEEQALRWAAKQGVLVVAAAGNEGVNSDHMHFYPADYPLPNILSVAALDQREHLLSASNYGIQTVHLAAPGKNIYSTLPNGRHGYMTGTSQATAFVSGVAALLIAYNPSFRHNPNAVIRHLMRNSSPRAYLTGKIQSHGLLNAQLALDHTPASTAN